MRVLIGYDGSAAADQALALVAGATWPAASECRVAVASGTPFAAYAPGVVADAATLQAVYDVQAEAAQQLATAAAERLGQGDLTTTWEVGLGRPASAVLDVADRFAPDLLVVGSRGLGPLTSALLGSVSEELVDLAPCPVLVARSPALRRVLLADDGSPDAQAASTLLLRWPIFRACDVRVIGVAERPELPTATADAARTAAHQVALAAVATTEELVRTTAARLSRAGLRADTTVRQGDPAAGILAEAAAWSADLIVIGTRGQTGLTRLLHGSVARKVLEHARCSVLVERRR